MSHINTAARVNGGASISVIFMMLTPWGRVFAPMARFTRAVEGPDGVGARGDWNQVYIYMIHRTDLANVWQ
jgi:hypothetical protein